MRSARSRLVLGLAAAWILLLSSCATIVKVTDALNEAGLVEDDVKTVVDLGAQIRNSFADLTEEEEYYIGRAVAALILSKYPVYEDAALTRYINLIGNAVAAYSDRPEIYAGYHFLVLDSDEVNALSAPSGFVFVTKGLLLRCEDEEMLGLVLAHEIGHVTAKHGLKAIKKSRLTDAFTKLGIMAVQAYGSKDLAELTTMFEGVLTDIVEQLVERGYSRSSEYEADGLGAAFGLRTGFDPGGMVRFLQTMVGDKSAVSGKGWFKTHPTPEQRIAGLNKQIATFGVVPQADDARTKRFQQAFNSLK